MKRILSLILTVAILLTSVVNAVVVLANNNPVITTKINLNDNYQYSFMTTGATSSTTITPDNGKLNVFVYGYERQLSNINSYSVKTWFPRYLLYKDGNALRLTNGNKAIVEVNYKVIGSINQTHGLQIGIGNNSSHSNTEIYVRNSRKHIAGDEGKEFTISSVFTADTQSTVKIAFSGGGNLEITSIVVHELPSTNINDYAVVKYVDGENETTEFVKKNSAPKIPENATDFKGWFTDKEFSGEAVTTITEDVTLYANRSETSSYDIVKTESTTPDNLVGASSNVSISMSGNKISTGSYNGYKLDVSGWGSWRPTFFFLTESGGTKSVFKTKQNSRYIVDMEYVVESPRTDNHSLQVGLFGNIGSNGQTESAIWLDTDAEGNKLFKTHPQADNGKTVNYTVAFTASSAHNLGLIFYGQGSITINSITIKEATDAYAIVKYVDGENETTEFVKKNGTPKTPENATDFKGWFTNKEFSGEAVTTVTGDITLYAKRETTTPIDPVSPLTTTVIDLNKEFEQYSFMTTGSTSSTTATLKDGKIAVSVSAYERQLANITSYGEKTWFPRLLLYKNDETFNLKTGDKAILEVKYKVIGSVNATHGLQIGLGNNPAASNTEIYVRTSKKHTSLDRGKEFTISSVFTVDANNKMKIAFSGGGQLEITSIVVHE
ncbi:MAG: InlB B-repeat-containing protein, partial [Clostridia bacterium]|nr:InlB B-repeat-containing protein [Clostridia bacterium]